MAEVSENQEIIENWLTALRSGEYKQVDQKYYNRLRFSNSGNNEFSYNVFGVFLELYDPSGWRQESFTMGGGWYYRTELKDGSNKQHWFNYIPRQITDLLAMPRAEKIITDTGDRLFFISFNKAADLIEKLLI